MNVLHTCKYALFYVQANVRDWTCYLTTYLKMSLEFLCLWWCHRARKLNYVFEVSLLNVGRETKYSERGRIFFLWPTALSGLGLLTVDTHTHTHRTHTPHTHKYTHNHTHTHKHNTHTNYTQTIHTHTHTHSHTPTHTNTHTHTLNQTHTQHNTHTHTRVPPGAQRQAHLIKNYRYMPD